MIKRWVGCDVEDAYFGDDRKLSKEERKRASAKDRSKYKKTDRDKIQKQTDLLKQTKLDKTTLKSGRVLSILPEGIVVECEGQRIMCGLRGVLKKEKGQHKNLVTVGDYVLFEPGGEGIGSIASVEPRRSILSRADNLSRRKEQIIASNIDQVLITVSVVEPPLKTALIDRYIIAAQKGAMEPILVVNKIDLLNDPFFDVSLREQQKEMLKEMIQAYTSLGITVVPISTKTGEGISALKTAMKDKASVFSGQSGVGKSSLINAVTGLKLEIGDIVEKTKKGSHTTTTTNLLPLDFGGWCIDTPGIKSFGVWDLHKEEIEHYFSEIFEVGHQCRFPDCSHTHEEGCAVKTAVNEDRLSLLRYESYLMLMASVAATHLRR